MDMVDAEVTPQRKRRPPPKKMHLDCRNRKRYAKNKAKTKIVYAKVRELTPEEDPNGTEKRRICLFIDDRKTIWLDIEDVPWAIRFLYVQNMLKGVPLVQDESTGPGGSSSADSQAHSPAVTRTMAHSPVVTGTSPVGCGDDDSQAPW